MEQLSSIFSRFRQQIGGAGDRSRNLDADCHDLDPSSAPEEDGFLVVGKTASEKTTVRASAFDMLGHQAPPSYDQVASMEASVSKHVPVRGFSMFASCSLTPSQPDTSPSSDTQNSGHHAALVGVPFQLNPRLQEKERLSAVLAQIDMHSQRFDWAKYEYDFDFERSSLKELCALNHEEAMAISPWSS